MLCSAGHAAEANEPPCEFDLAHVTQPVLVDPTLIAIKHGDASFAADSCAVGRRDDWGIGVGDDDTVEFVEIDLLQLGLSAIKDCSLVELELLEVPDALVDHVLDRLLLAMVVDGHLHPVLPLLVPNRQLTGKNEEGGILHVRVMEQREGNRQHAFALEMVHMLEVHRAHCLVVERMHRCHATLQ